MVSSGLLPLVEAGLYDHLPRRGVIHVGANDGAEIQWYLDRSIEPILCFEPNPDAYQRGVSRWQDRPQATFVPLALGADSGMIEMGLPADGDDEKTSHLEPIPTEGHEWTEVPMATRIQVPVMRFDEWVARRTLHIPQHLHDDTDDSESASMLTPKRGSAYKWGNRGRVFRDVEVPTARFDEVAAQFDITPYGTLVVDVQGMELEVLQGFGLHLETFNVLCVELSQRPIYRGEPAAAEVIEWLGQRGFRQATEVVAHGDVCFLR